MEASAAACMCYLSPTSLTFFLPLMYKTKQKAHYKHEEQAQLLVQMAASQAKITHFLSLPSKESKCTYRKANACSYITNIFQDTRAFWAGRCWAVSWFLPITEGNSGLPGLHLLWPCCNFPGLLDPTSWSWSLLVSGSVKMKLKIDGNSGQGCSVPVGGCIWSQIHRALPAQVWGPGLNYRKVCPEMLLVQ